MKGLASRISMNCKDAIEVLADYLESTLTPGVLEKLEAHLRACAPCRAYLATYKRTAELAAKINRVEMPPDVRRRLRDFLSGSLGSTS
jgi:predicted anti-sigma-YlaC factor YlaD